MTPVRTVVLAPGATAHAELQYLDVAVQTSPVCSHAHAVYMNVGPIVPGVGTIYG